MPRLHEQESEWSVAGGAFLICLAVHVSMKALSRTVSLSLDSPGLLCRPGMCIHGDNRHPKDINETLLPRSNGMLRERASCSLSMPPSELRDPIPTFGVVHIGEASVWACICLEISFMFSRWRTWIASHEMYTVSKVM